MLSPTNQMSRRTLSLLTNIFSITARWIALQRSMLGSGLELDTGDIKKKQSEFTNLGSALLPSSSFVFVSIH